MYFARKRENGGALIQSLLWIAMSLRLRVMCGLRVYYSQHNNNNNIIHTLRIQFYDLFFILRRPWMEHNIFTDFPVFSFTWRTILCSLLQYTRYYCNTVGL